MISKNSIVYIIDDTYGFGGIRLYVDCPTIRSSRTGLKVLIMDFNKENKDLKEK